MTTTFCILHCMNFREFHAVRESELYEIHGFSRFVNLKW